MKRFCEEHDRLIYLNSIDKLLDLISSEDEERYERAVNLFDSKRNEILEEIKENLFTIRLSYWILKGMLMKLG